MNISLERQGEVMDDVRGIARTVKLTEYDVAFENRGGVDFVVLTLKSGVKVPQELCTGWQDKLTISLVVVKKGQATLEKKVDETIAVAVLHKPSGKWTASEIPRKHIRDYAVSVVESFKKIGSAHADDFAVIEVDWNSRTIDVTKLA